MEQGTYKKYILFHKSSCYEPLTINFYLTMNTQLKIVGFHRSAKAA
jgi:hypothetical protein